MYFMHKIEVTSCICMHNYYTTITTTTTTTTNFDTEFMIFSDPASARDTSS